MQSKEASKASEGKEGEKGKPYENKDEAYFSYYSLLSHQAQMLQDSVRTSAYQRAILGHPDCFRDKRVIDVGAGNGILSLFAAQAGARKVYAVEASNMVAHLQRLVDAAKPQGASAAAAASVKNPWLGERVVPVHSKMEDVTAEMLDGKGQCDTIISECLGVLLLHERMCESFIDARDRFLKPGGAMFPSAGTICLAPLEDRVLWDETATKARWWDTSDFYGVDLTPFSESAWNEAFGSPVVGCFNAGTLLGTSSDYLVDFTSVTKAQLEAFVITLDFAPASTTAVVHGLGGWFDLHFLPASSASGSKSASATEDDTMHDATSPAPSSDATVDAVPSSTSSQSAYGGLSSSAPTFQPSSSDAASLAAAAATSGGVAQHSYMSTSPYEAPTHWQQVRFLLPEPIAVNKGQRLTGTLEFKVNDARSYTITGRLSVDASTDRLLMRTCEWRLDRQTYSWSSGAA